MKMLISEDDLRYRLTEVTVAEVATSLGCNRTSIYRKMRQFGIPLPGRKPQPSPLLGRKVGPKYNPDEYATDWTTDPIKQQAWAYLLGVYLGDGCVTQSGQTKRPVFTLNTVDEDFREATVIALRVLTPYAVTCLPPYQPKLANAKVNYALVCGDGELCRRLVEVTDSKKKLPELPSGTELEFIAGLMDSEGSVSEQRNKKTNRGFNIAFKQCFDAHEKHPWINDFHALLRHVGAKPGKIGIGKPYRSHYKTPHRFGINIQSWIDSGCYFKIRRKQQRIELWASADAYTQRARNPRGGPPRLCSIMGCDKRHLAKDLCANHYRQRYPRRRKPLL